MYENAFFKLIYSIVFQMYSSSFAIFRNNIRQNSGLYENLSKKQISALLLKYIMQFFSDVCFCKKWMSRRSYPTKYISAITSRHIRMF
jgi:hypothetical protein